MITLIGFDADDTLWRCEKFFREAEREFAALFDRPPEESIGLYQQIAEANIPRIGYGIASSLQAMLACGNILAGGSLDPARFQAIVRLNRKLADHPVELLPGAAEAVKILAGRCRLRIITKGRREEQERKLRLSGLSGHFEAMDVFPEKTAGHYRRLLERLSLAPASFLMIGDSRSGDVDPVKEIGGGAVYLSGTEHWRPDRGRLRPDREIRTLEELPELLLRNFRLSEEQPIIRRP